MSLEALCNCSCCYFYWHNYREILNETELFLFFFFHFQLLIWLNFQFTFRGAWNQTKNANFKAHFQWLQIVSNLKGCKADICSFQSIFWGQIYPEHKMWIKNFAKICRISNRIVPFLHIFFNSSHFWQSCGKLLFY